MLHLYKQTSRLCLQWMNLNAYPSQPFCRRMRYEENCLFQI